MKTVEQVIAELSDEEKAEIIKDAVKLAYTEDHDDIEGFAIWMCELVDEHGGGLDV